MTQAFCLSSLLLAVVIGVFVGVVVCATAGLIMDIRKR